MKTPQRRMYDSNLTSWLAHTLQTHLYGAFKLDYDVPLLLHTSSLSNPHVLLMVDA